MHTSRSSVLPVGGFLRFGVAALLIWTPLALGAFAQEPGQEPDRPVTAATVVVPQQVRYAGKLAVRAGQTVAAEFRIYAAQEGGEPLWTETQQFPVAADGSYSVLLGSMSQAGLPQSVFSGGTARWLGVSVERGQEQERVLMSSVPYAMKSADAESLAGHAASDFVTQEQLAALGANAVVPIGSASTGPAGPQPLTSGPISGSGTSGNVAIFTGANTIGNSDIVQVGNDIGINVTTPAALLDVGGTATVRGTLDLPPLNTANTTSGYNSNSLELGSSAWSTTTAGPVTQNFFFQNLATGNNTASPSAKIDLLFASGGGSPAATGLSFGSNGLINFAAGQTFPGASTITTITTASPLTGGGSSGPLTLSLSLPTLEASLDTVYPQLATGNTFKANQSITGSLTTTVAVNTAALNATTASIQGLTTAIGGINVGNNVQMHQINVATPTTPFNSPFFQFIGSAYNSSTSAAVNQNFSWQTVVTGNNTASPSGYLQLLSGSGSTQAATGLSIAKNGVITFVGGQTFPSAGTITGITTSSPLTGSGTSGSVALGFNTAALETTLNSVYPQLATTNVFTAGASFGGPISAAASGVGSNAVTATGTSGAYGITATSDTGNAGNFANSSAPAATLFTEDTANFDGSYIPVALNATATGTDSIGAYGTGGLAGVFGTSAGLGVWGVSGRISALPTITSTGVLGNATSPAGGDAGVLGYTGTSQSGSYSYEAAKTGMAGVWGDTTGNPTSVDDFSAGVMGTTDALDGYGGVFIANSADTFGMFAKNLNSGDGIYGESLGVGVVTGSGGSEGTGGAGIVGFTPSPSKGNAGVVGYAYQLSATYSTVQALGPVGLVAGVWGDSGEVNDGTATYTAGVVGTGDDITAGIFENNSQHPTLSVTNLDTSGGGTGLFKTFMASTPDGTCGIGGGGNLTCTGQMKSLATTGDARKVETYSMQSAENWMEDFGSAKLEGGVAVVRLDPTFSETVSADGNYKVFITPNGDAEALYVINKTANSFEVRESKGGTSSLSFDYRIVGKRRGFEAQRLTDVTERFNTEHARAMLPTAGAVAHSSRAQRPTLGNPGKFGTPGGNVTPRTPSAQPHKPSRAVKVGAGRVETAKR